MPATATGPSAVPAAVLAAFSVRDEVVALEGGQGSSVRAGALVLKPGADIEETEWFASLSDRVVRHGFRLPRPIRAIDGRWVVADEVAWEGRDLLAGPRSTLLLRRLRRLRRMSRPLDLEAQLVHGDLSGNVLLESGLDPSVIDVSPYWRPSRYADAVVVIDALLWWNAAPSVRVGEVTRSDRARGRRLDTCPSSSMPTCCP